MEVIVYPIEQWFCYYVIDELLKEGYEVYAYREIEAKDKLQNRSITKLNNYSYPLAGTQAFI